MTLSVRGPLALYDLESEVHIRGGTCINTIPERVHCKYNVH